jgi:type IX secretion system PorP/SprF family membrane protein
VSVDPWHNPHQWNSLIITSIYNPALTGLENKHHFYFDYGRPWYHNFDNSISHNKYDVCYDVALTRSTERFKASLGVYFSGLIQEYMQEKSMGIINSFSIKFKNRSELSGGFSVLTLSIKTLDYSKLRFPNQFDGNGFAPNLSGERFETDKIVDYGPLNVGVWYNAKNFFAGVSALNLTALRRSSPDRSLLEVEGAETPLTMYFNGGYHFNINEKFVLTPSLQARYELSYFYSFNPRVTFSFSRSRFLVGAYYENDALYGLLGVSLFKHHWLINFDAGLFVNNEVHTGMQGFKVKTRVNF